MRRKAQCILMIVFIMMLSNSNITTLAAGNANINVDVEYGYDNIFEFGEHLPITIHAENNQEDIDGEIKLQYHIGDKDGVLTSKITLAKGSKKDIQFVIPSVSDDLAIIKLSFVENKDVIYEEKLLIPFTQGVSEGNLILGTLTDDYDALNYIQLKYDYKKVKLNADNFPENIFASKMLDVILVNDFDLSKLNEKQLDTMKEWVNAGGHLILGTGVNYSKTLSSIKEFLQITSIGDITEMDINSLNGYVNEESEESKKEYAPLATIQIDNEKYESFTVNGDEKVAYKLGIGKGSVDLFTFDLGMEPMKSYEHNKKFMETYFEKRMLDRKNRIGRGMPSSYEVNSTDRFLKVLPEMKLPSLAAISSIIGIYIVIVGPILYILLKRKKKRHYMWIGIPILSIIFVLFMYMFGMNTRIKHPITQVVNIVNFDDEGGYSSSFGTVMNTNKSSLEVKTNEGLHIIPLAEDNRYYGYNSNDMGNALKEYKDFPVLYNWDLGIDSKIIFYKPNVFSNSNFGLEVSKNVPTTNQLQIEVLSNGRELEGKITNNYDFDLEDCTIIYRNKCYTIPRLGAGETTTIEAFTLEKFNSIEDYYWQRMDNVPRGSISLKNQLYQKNRIIRFNDYNDNYNANNSYEMILTAWTDKAFSKGFLVNDIKAKNYEKTLLTVKAPVDFMNGETIVLDYGNILPFVDGERITNNYYYSQDKEYTLVYKLPVNAIGVEKIMISKSFEYDDKTGQIVATTQSKHREKWGEVEYTLLDSNNNPSMTLEDIITIEKEDIAKFVNSDGELILTGSLDSDGDVEIPVIYVEGVGK